MPSILSSHFSESGPSGVATRGSSSETGSSSLPSEVDLLDPGNKFERKGGMIQGGEWGIRGREETKRARRVVFPADARLNVGERSEESACAVFRITKRI